MITQDETNLTTAQYAAVRDGTHPIAKQLLIQRRNLLFESEVFTSELDSARFDVCFDDTYIYLAYIKESTLYVRRYTPGGTWSAPITISADVQNVAPSFGEIGDALWGIGLFYVKTDGNIYRADTNDEFDTFTNAQYVDCSSLGTITHLAASTPSDIFFAEWRSDYNTRLHHAKAQDWVVSSNIYWPHHITGMDALYMPSTQGYFQSSHLLVLSSPLPYQFGLKAEGTTTVVSADERSGVVGFLVKDNFWSDHIAIESFDDATEYQIRKYPHLTRIESDYGEDLIALVCYGVDGDSDYYHRAHHLYFSCDGKSWTLDHLLNTTGHVSGGALCRIGDKAYFVSRRGCLISESTELTGHISPAVQEDITERVISYRSAQSNMRQTSVSLVNNDDWYSTSLLADGGVFSLTTKVGVIMDGAERLVTVAHDIVDAIQPQREAPSEDLDIIARDLGQLMTGVRAAHIREDDSQVLGADDFWDNGIENGGLKHTAALRGSWGTANNLLKLTSDDESGVAITTFNLRIWNGSIQAKLIWDSDDDDIGFTFRCFDKDNHYRIVYDISADMLQMREIREGESAWYHQVAANMGWVAGVSRWLKIDYRYNFVRVYWSSNGSLWSDPIPVILPGKDPDILIGTRELPIEEGSVGYVGAGISDEDDWDFDDPPYEPPQDDVESPGLLSSGTARIAAFADNGCVFITEDFTTPSAQGGPSWNKYLLNVDDDVVQFVVDAYSPAYIGTGAEVHGWLFTKQSIYRIQDIFGARTLTHQFTFTYNTDGRSADFCIGTRYHGAVASVVSGQPVLVTYTRDGETWETEVQVTPDYETGGTGVPGIYVSPKTPGLVYVTAYDETAQFAGASGYKSTDYGATWTRMNGTNGPSIITEFRLGVELHVPYNDNDDEDIVYYSDGKHDNAALMRNESGYLQSVAPVTGQDDPFSPRYTRWSVVSSFQNRQKMAAGLKGKYSWSRWGIFVSENAGDTWAMVDEANYSRVAIAGDEDNVLYLWGAQDYGIGYSDDFGATIDDRTGDIVPEAGTNPAFIGICGG